MVLTFASSIGAGVIQVKKRINEKLFILFYLNYHLIDWKSLPRKRKNDFNRFRKGIKKLCKK